MITEPIQLKLRPFSQTDFGRLISWVSTPETLGQWCAAFFRYPLDEDFLRALGIMPPASGIALGFDRLAMLATGAQRVEQVLWTPVAEPQ